MSEFNCRMYEKKYPEENEVVMVMVQSVGEMGVYVSLLEYNGIEEEIVECEERYNKSKAVHSIMRHLSTRLTQMSEKPVKPKQLYKQFGWALYTKYQHAYDAFRVSITEPTAVFEGFDITPEQLKVLCEIIAHKLKPQPLKIRADLEMTCFDYEGIDAIKASIIAAQSHAMQFVAKPADGAVFDADKAFGVVVVTLIAPPLYVMVGTFDDKEKGLAMLNKCVSLLGEELEKRKGKLAIKIPPRAVGASDDQELDDLMEQLGRENQLVDGDESDDDEEDEEEEKPKKSSSKK
eukprot:gene7194-8357_t